MYSVPLNIVIASSPTTTLVSSVSMEDLSTSSSHDAQVPLLTHNAPNIANKHNTYTKTQLPYSLVDAFHATRSQSDAAEQLHRSKTGGPYREHVSTLLDEINSKYYTEQGMFVVDDDNSHPACIFAKPMCSPTKPGNSHLPGKRTHGGDLEVMILNHANIGHLGNVGTLADLMHNVTELDLTGNFIGDWKQVTTLLTLTPSLTTLNMSRNPLHKSAPVDWQTANGRVRHERLKLLVLNSTNIKWDTLYALLDMLPELKELFLSMNDYSKRKRLPSRELIEGKTFSHIRTLYVNNCGLNTWPSLVRVCAPFDHLESLVAAENPLKQFGDPDDAAFARTFAHTTQLNVNRTAIDSWHGVNTIRHFKALHTLRLYQECFDDETERWMQTVARLPNITHLNGTRVSTDQRINAERAYLRMHYEGEKEARYDELVQVHGVLEPLVEIDLTPKHTADLSFDEVIRVPLNKSVMYLRHEILGPKLGVSSDRLRLRHKSSENAVEDRWADLTLNSVAMHSMGIQDNDVISAEIMPERKVLQPYLKRSQVSGSTSKTTRAPVGYRTNKLLQQRIERSLNKSQD